MNKTKKESFILKLIIISIAFNANFSAISKTQWKINVEFVGILGCFFCFFFFLSLASLVMEVGTGIKERNKLTV